MHFRICALLLLCATVAVPLHADPETPSAGLSRFFRQAATAAGKGLTTVRVYLIASDYEWEQMKEMFERIEHAIEPPSDVEGFWYRKYRLLRHPMTDLLPALDFRRSFQNLARTFRVMRNEPEGWQRDMLASSGLMLGLTHGTEFAIGVSSGLYSLAQGDFAQAGGWFGLAIPGLYDFGCWIGQATLLTRPGRVGFNAFRKALIYVAGRGAELVGLRAALNAILEYEPARERLLAAAAKHGTQVIELQIPDEAMMRFTLKDERGEALIRFQFRENERGELVLQTAEFDKNKLAKTPYRDIKPVLNDLGWNVKGAIRELQKLLFRGRPDLLSEEKTFVSEVTENAERGTTVVHFVDHAVAVTAKRHFRAPWRERRWPSSPESCSVKLAALKAG